MAKKISTSTILEQLHILKGSGKWYTTPWSDWNKNDKELSEEYEVLENFLRDSAKKLKLGATVQFNFPVFVGKKNPKTGMRSLKDQLFTGVVHKALYNKVRKGYEEDSLIPTIKVATATHIYEVSPREICEIKKK